MEKRYLTEAEEGALAEMFKVFGDKTRVGILGTLAGGAKSVGAIANALNMTTSAISHQLRILKQAKLIKNERKGKEIIYQIDDDHVYSILDCALLHIREK